MRSNEIRHRAVWAKTPESGTGIGFAVDFRFRKVILQDLPLAPPELAGALYHVTSRGDGREDIYLSDEDRVAWLETLARVCKRFNWACHAYCQMTNHYHLVGQHTMAAIAEHFGVHYTTVSRLVKAYEAMQKRGIS